MKKEHKKGLCIAITGLALLWCLIVLIQSGSITDFIYRAGDEIFHRLDIMECNKAIKLHDKNGVIACKSIADYYLEKPFDKPDYNDYKKAIEAYDKAISLDSEHAVSYWVRGWMYTKLNNYDKAIEDFNKAIELDKDYQRAYVELSKVYKELNQPEKAEEYLKKAIDLGYEPEKE